MAAAINFASMIDHTLLKPEAGEDAIRRLCEEALEHCFAAACVNSIWIPLVSKLLAGSDVVPCAVVGFPLGASLSVAKAEEARAAIDAGAGEIDMVIAVGLARDGQWDAVKADIEAVHQACGPVPLKVIFETCLLSTEQIRRLCEICRDLGVAFVKTSTGFGSAGATLEHVRLMREVVGPQMGIKASGGVRDAETAQAMVEAGATRLGTSSGIAIINGAVPAGSDY